MSANDGAAILLVEDEALFAKAVARRLERDGYDCHVVGKLGDAVDAVKAGEPDLLLLDMRLPDGSGLDFLERYRGELRATAPVIVMTAYGDVEDAVAAMKLSAAEYLKKPVDLDELSIIVKRTLANREVSQQLEYSRTREAHVAEEVTMIGDAEQMRMVREQIGRIAALSATADGAPPTVLLTGETGTGKDVAARLLHQLSAKHTRPFVHVDCASLPKDLIEAELFGHVKGAFTSAHTERTGLIEAAEDGMVFLDEFGELPLELQAKLLAVLERRTLRRVGSSQERKVSAWFVAATNRDVDEMVASGALRSDLYYRLNVLSLTLPPLRARGEDIVELAKHFGLQTARRYGISEFELRPDAEEALRRYRWPGNVRELRHVMERATMLSDGHALTAAGLMLAATTSAAPHTDDGRALDGLTLDEAERLLIERTLARTDNNVSRAARELGVTRMAMRYRMKKHHLV